MNLIARFINKLLSDCLDFGTVLQCLCVAVLLLAPNVHAQKFVDTQQAGLRFELKAIYLEGFEAAQHANLSQEQVNQAIARERARFTSAVSTDDLHTIADALTLFFRAQGYAFHSVFLPPQTVRAGVVILQLQAGVLGDVHVINHSRYKDRAFAAPFKKLQNKLLFAGQVEQVVQALKMQGDAQIFAFFSRGDKPGHARLNLRVENAAKRSVRASLDNYGSASSGEHRLIAAYTERQLTGHHDKLSLSLLRVMDDIDNTYGNIHYSLPFAGLKYQLSASYSNNQYEVGERFAALGLQGNFTSQSIGLRRYSDFKPHSRSSLQLLYAQKQSDLANEVGLANQEDSLSWSLGWQKRWGNASGSSLLQSNLSAALGGFTDLEASTQRDFTKLSMSEFLVIGGGGGARGKRNVLQLSVRAQYAQDALPQAETMSLTGIYGARGFAPGSFNAERGAVASLEWRWPNILPTNKVRAEPFFLADWAGGQSGQDSETSRGQFTAVGGGLRIALGRHISAQLAYAAALEGRINDIEVPKDDQLWLELRFD